MTFVWGALCGLLGNTVTRGSERENAPIATISLSRNNFVWMSITSKEIIFQQKQKQQQQPEVEWNNNKLLLLSLKRYKSNNHHHFIESPIAFCHRLIHLFLNNLIVIYEICSMCCLILYYFICSLFLWNTNNKCRTNQHNTVVYILVLITFSLINIQSIQLQRT